MSDLKEIHNDKKAEKILGDLEVEKEENPVSPAWETQLIEKSFKEAKILENDVYTHIETLKKYRNLSAHPVLNSMDILYRPNKEQAESLIKNMLEGLLTKHPLFTKNVFAPFMEEVERIKNDFSNKEKFGVYLDSKFFVHFNKELTEYMFKNLWKLVFKSNGDREKNNRQVNYDVLLIMYKKYEDILVEFIKKESAFFSDFLDEKAIISKLIDFLSRYAKVYDLLKPHAQGELQNRVKEEKAWKVRGIFLSDSLKDHFKYVDSSIHSQSFTMFNQPYIKNYLLTNQDIVFLREMAEREGVIEEFYDLMISHYYHSGGFDEADITFNKCIEPFYKDFNKEQFEVLLKEINSNPQCYNGRYSSRNKVLLGKAKELMPDIDVQIKYANIFGE
ncbi:hypothetical protein bthur0007_55630 [Bacillus thuringiensis serovar monterrey BGSC 4AJ1]|nr:hypothetical protein bthur0007_55630 [Bacillus thuringiensis serovar monterrey BGSC 4AJ1]